MGQGEGPRELMWGGQEPGQKKGESARPRKGREKHEAAVRPLGIGGLKDSTAPVQALAN